ELGPIRTATATGPDGSPSESSLCTAPAGATTTTTTMITHTTRPRNTTTTVLTITTTTTSVGATPSPTLPGGGPCTVAATFSSLECRLDQLAIATVAQAGIGRRTQKIQRRLERAAQATRDSDAARAQGRGGRTPAGAPPPARPRCNRQDPPPA